MKKVKYLGKKKMYDLLVAKYGREALPPLKECGYVSYRGSEWLKFDHVKEYEFYELYNNGSYLSLERYGHEEDWHVVSVNRATYNLEDECLVVRWQRYPKLAIL